MKVTAARDNDIYYCLEHKEDCDDIQEDTLMAMYGNDEGDIDPLTFGPDGSLAYYDSE